MLDHLRMIMKRRSSSQVLPSAVIEEEAEVAEPAAVAPQEEASPKPKRKGGLLGAGRGSPQVVIIRIAQTWSLAVVVHCAMRLLLLECANI